MNLERLGQALDGLQAAYHNGGDIELGLRALVPHGFTLEQMERFSRLREFKKIASTARRMIRDDAETTNKEPEHVQG